MASDRFVNWKDKKPTQEEVERVLQDYFHEAATEIVWKEDRFLVTLVGKNSYPLTRISGGAPICIPDEGWEGRYMEVWLGEDSLDVLTRRQDEFTMRVADGLAALFARFWQGKLEMG